MEEERSALHAFVFDLSVAQKPRVLFLSRWHNVHSVSWGSFVPSEDLGVITTSARPLFSERLPLI